MIATGVRSQSWSASSVIITRITTSVRFTKVITSTILIRRTTWGTRMSLRVIVTGGRMTLGARLPPWRSSQPLVTARALTCPASTASAWPERLMADLMTLTAWWRQHQQNIRKNFKQQQPFRWTISDWLWLAFFNGRVKYDLLALELGVDNNNESKLFIFGHLKKGVTTRLSWLYYVIVAVVTCLQHSPWWPGSAPTAVRSSSLLLIWLGVHSAPSPVQQYTNIPTQVQMQ